MNARWPARGIYSRLRTIHAVFRQRGPSMGRAGQEHPDAGAIISRIGALFEREHAGPAPTASEIREALADGYACLIALEADRVRAARRSAELFASGTGDRSAAR